MAPQAADSCVTDHMKKTVSPVRARCNQQVPHTEHGTTLTLRSVFLFMNKHLHPDFTGNTATKYGKCGQSCATPGGSRAHCGEERPDGVT